MEALKYIDEPSIGLRKLSKPLWGVSTKGLDNTHQEYKIELERSVWSELVLVSENSIDFYEQLQARLNQTFSGNVSFGYLPWAPSQVLYLGRSLHALCSFCDDYDDEIMVEYFPVNESLQFLEIVLQKGSPVEPLKIDEQWSIALQISEGNPIAASIICHSALRAVARNMDKRVGPSFDFPMDFRIRAAKAIACFPSGLSKHRDPLGDSYHYWSTVLAGMILILNRKRPLIARAAYRAMFYYSANLMYLVRQSLFGHQLLFGTHGKVDRLGLTHGLKLGRWMLNKEA